MPTRELVGGGDFQLSAGASFDMFSLESSACSGGVPEPRRGHKCGCLPRREGRRAASGKAGLGSRVHPRYQRARTPTQLERTMAVTDRVKQILSWYSSENPGTLTNLARILNSG